MPEKNTPAADFYDVVADEYNSHMTDKDRAARGIISRSFSSVVKAGNVLDFGGGTGLDLAWLSGNSNYKTFFLETSKKMRQVALNNFASAAGGDKISFAKHNLDFNEWNVDNLPFNQRMDGILANFAVLNSIPNIESFFDKIQLMCNPGCSLFLTLINARNPAIFKQQPFKSMAMLLFNKKLTITNVHNGVRHASHIHSVRDIKRASQKHFKYVSSTSVQYSNFVLVVLSKK